MVEHRPFKALVLGSSPSALTTFLLHSLLDVPANLIVGKRLDCALFEGGKCRVIPCGTQSAQIRLGNVLVPLLRAPGMGCTPSFRGSRGNNDQDSVSSGRGHFLDDFGRGKSLDSGDDLHAPPGSNDLFMANDSFNGIVAPLNEHIGF